MTEPVRVEVVVLLWAVIDADPLPVELGGETESHDVDVLAVHEQELPVVTLTGEVPPAEVKVNEVGAAVNEQPEVPAWVTVIDCPFTVIVPERDAVMAFAVAVTVTLPLPCPEVGETDSQETLSLAVQLQLEVVEARVRFEVPPFAPKESEGGEAVTVQPVPAGLLEMVPLEKE